jgi:hypothetical protein
VLANRPLYFTAKRLEMNSPGLQAWVRKEMKFALQGQPNVFLSPPPDIILLATYVWRPFGAHFRGC